MTAVADSSRLIALASISAFQLLEPLFGEIVIPEAVHAEVVLQGFGRPGEREVAGARWIAVRPIGEFRRVEALQGQYRIRGGEAEAIVLANELGADWLLMDERLGRQAAGAVGLRSARLIGTLGILLAAKTQGLIQDVTRRMVELQDCGFRIDAALYRAVRRRAGEDR